MEFFITADGLPLHVYDNRKGDKILVFLHGYLETLYIWEEFISLLPDSFRIITLDLPGHGLSGTKPDINTMSVCSSVIHELLINKLSLDKFTIIGHSMGGYIAQEYLRHYPESVEAIVHFGSNPYSDPPAKLDSRLSEISLINEGKLSCVAASSIPLMYSQKNLRHFDEKIQETLEISETHDPNGIIASLRGIIERTDSVELLNTTEIPVSFIIGDDDYFLPQERIDAIRKDLPKACYSIIPNAGHNTFIESPEATRDALLSFLKQISLTRESY